MFYKLILGKLLSITKAQGNLSYFLLMLIASGPAKLTVNPVPLGVLLKSSNSYSQVLTLMSLVLRSATKGTGTVRLIDATVEAANIWALETKF